MRVFVLCTGRTGSVALWKACGHATNYTVGHESRAKESQDRLDYPDNHIEADNRLSWFLGALDSKFGDEPFFVHLTRDRDATARSFMNRWGEPGSVVDSFAEGILKSPPELLTDEERRNVCGQYVDTVNSNIEHFLKDKSKKITIRLEHIKEDFVNFWEQINMEGDITAALSEFDVQHNTSAELGNQRLYKIKLSMLKFWRLFKK